MSGSVSGTVSGSASGSARTAQPRVDRDVCVGAGQCVLAAPDVFDQSDEDGLSYVLLDPVPAEQAAAVRDAVYRCPARAVSLEEIADEHAEEES